MEVFNGAGSHYGRLSERRGYERRYAGQQAWGRGAAIWVWPGSAWPGAPIVDRPPPDAVGSGLADPDPIHLPVAPGTIGPVLAGCRPDSMPGAWRARSTRVAEPDVLGRGGIAGSAGGTSLPALRLGCAAASRAASDCRASDPGWHWRAAGSRRSVADCLRRLRQWHDRPRRSMRLGMVRLMCGVWQTCAPRSYGRGCAASAAG